MDTMTADEFRKLTAQKGRRSKYRAKRTAGPDGETYASQAEARRAAELALMLRAGEIRQYGTQPRYELGCPENVYVGDFEVTDRAGNVWTEDVKGFRTPKFSRDCKLWASYGPHPLRVLTAHGKRGWTMEVIPGG